MFGRSPRIQRAAVCVCPPISCLVLALGLGLLVPPASRGAWTGTDEEFVAMVEQRNWEYFKNNQGGPGMMFRGAGHYNETNSYDVRATSAGDGYGIASLCVGAYRGWMSDDEAYNRIVAILRTYDNFAVGSSARDWNGLFRHFFWFDTAQPDTNSEYSVVDTTWLVAGALLAAEYFKGSEIETIANRIYEEVNFAGCYSPYYTGYNEFMIVNILGAGSPTHAWSDADNRGAWNANMHPNYYGPLFWYQWPQNYVDFRRRRDENGYYHHGAAMTAMLMQRQQCIDLHNADPTRYNDYGTNCWGLTSAMASGGRYLEMRPWAGWMAGYGEWMDTAEEGSDSGTVVPICIPACMAHVPYETREAMKYIYNTYGGIPAFGVYTFMNAFNTGNAWTNGQHYSMGNASMDYGANVLALENFRSGMPWTYAMAHPSMENGLNRCGVTTDTIVAYHDDWNDGADPNAWNGGTSTTNSDGTPPTASYVDIAWYTNWVNGKARCLATTGSGMGDIVRIQFAEGDQSRNDLLSFWLRGESGGEQFDVGLRDTEGHEFRVSITNYVSGGVVSATWVRVRIPLRSFAVTTNANSDVRLVCLGDFNVRFRAAGTIYVDDLAFLDDDLAPQPPPFGAACVDGRVYLRWSYAPDDDVVGYHLWRRPDTGSGFTRINGSLLVADHDETDASVESDWGEDFYYAAQCVDRHENAGAFSSGRYEQRVWIGRHRDLDWGDGQNPNTLGGSHNRWGGSWGTIQFEEQTGWDGRTKWVRRVAGDTWNGCYVELKGGSVAPYEALAFWLKQEWGANTLDVGLKSTNGVEVKVPITDYVAVTDSWQYVVIPFADFRTVDFRGMDNVSFTFTTAGNLFVDEMRFLRLEPSANQLFVREGERAEGFIGGNTNDFKWYASETFCLGNSWATNAGDEAWWTITSGAPLAEACLDVRYACGAGVGRTLQVLVNGAPRGDLNVQTTGGWGDGAGQFREDTVCLGLITNTVFQLKLRAAAAGSAVNLDRVILRSATRYFREAEDWDAQSGSGGADYKPGSCGGQVLGWSWGGGNGDYAEYTNIFFPSEFTGAVLRARYGQDWGDGRLLTVRLDGTNMGRIAFPRTWGWLDNWSDGGLSELPLGTIPAGTHTLRLEAEGSDEDLNLDWIRIDEQASESLEHDGDGDGIPDSAEALYGTSASLADTDGDGAADLDEISRADGYLTNPTNADTDADGMRDGDELWAGSDPTSATSAFGVASTAVWTNDRVLVRWPSLASRQYTVLRATNLLMTSGAFSALASNIAATPPENTYTDAPSTSLRFYRVGVQR